MENNKEKTSKVLGDVIKKAKRQEGDVHPKNPNLVWTKTPSGHDWRKKPEAGGTKVASSVEKIKKLQSFLEKTDDDKLKSFASKPNNSPNLRQMAFTELEKRGVDTSDIDLNTGKLGKINSHKEIWSENEEADADLEPDSIEDILEEEEDDMEWTNPDYIKKKFGGLKTKQQRIDADKFIHAKKTSLPNYKPPHEEIWALNRAFAVFLKSDSPLMIASGGAGVGKSWNFHFVAEAMGKRPFDPATDKPGEGDYDYVEAPEIASEVQLVSLLKEHNGKIILFDDADNVLKESRTLGIMKKATASSGKRILGKKSSNEKTNVDPFEFKGQIAFLTNMNQDDLTKDENIKAIYSRALKKDIQFTKREQLSFIHRLKDAFEFTGVQRLEDKDKDKAERDAVFNMIKDNIDYIDPAKFNSRTMKEALEIKRSVDESNFAFQPESNIDIALATQMFGQEVDWKDEVGAFLTKGVRTPIEERLQKAENDLGLDNF